MRFFAFLLIFSVKVLTVFGHNTDRNSNIEKAIPNEPEIFRENKHIITVPTSKLDFNRTSKFKLFRRFGEEEIEWEDRREDNMKFSNVSYYSSIENDSINQQIGYADQMLAKIKDEGRFVDYLSLGQSFQLPVGVQKTVGGIPYTVIFHELYLEENLAYVDAYLVIELPSGQKLTFMGRGIEFSAAGGIAGVGRVELLGNNNISFAEESAEQKILLTVYGGTPRSPGQTYANFDCFGFRELSIDAGITFSKDYLLKENPDGSIADERVTCRFQKRISDWNNIVVDITLPKFQLPGLTGWSFEVNSAILDLSDSQNANDLIFPPDYNSSYFINGDQKLWRGFFLRKLKVTLPEEYNKRDESKRTSFYTRNLIIDQDGLTGTFGTSDLITLSEGDASSWKLSVDGIEVDIFQNEFISGQINGQIEVPSINTEEPLLYSGSFTGSGKYNLVAGFQSNAKFDVFNADLDLSSNSVIELKVIEGNFKPRAVLHGSMDVKPTSSSNKEVAEVNGLIFQSLVLQTEAPYIDAQYFGFKSDNKENSAGGFSIGIEEVALETDVERNRIGILTSVNVNLVKADDSGFGADGTFNIWAKQTSFEDQIRYQYDKIELSRIEIEVTRAGFGFNGSLQFYEGDDTYGDGFKGQVNASFGATDGAIAAQATALFGSVDGFRYWYVDALVEWENGFLVGGAFSVNGLGGGAYYHMRQQGLNEKVGIDLSKSNSGIVYIPDESVYLGIKASVVFSLQNAETAANGKAEFGISFNSNGGVNQIAFNGSVKMMTQSFASDLGKVKELASKVSNQEAIKSESGSAFTGDVKLLFDNRNKSFHGIIDVYVNVGGGVVTGSNPGYLAGRSILHFEKDYWYIHIGKPSNPIGLQFLGFAKANSYFMIGHDIPGIPPPPQLVLDILTSEQRARNEKIRNSSRDLTELSSGKGFAFGANFNLDTGEKRHLAIFYGRFAATAGFDINLVRYNASCSGQAGLVGVNGWYAQGQAYMGLLATIGMDINLKFLKKKVEIFHGELAALMQIKGPNPFWMRGDAAGSFSVLDGLVEGSFDFDIEIGEVCKLESSGESPLKEMKVIAELTPEDKSQEIDVFTTPQAVFNIPVEKEFEILGYDRSPLAYRVKLDYFRLQAGNEDFEADIAYNSDKNVFVLDPKRVLPSTTELELDIRIHFEEKKNGKWVKFQEKNKVVTETLKYSFTTGLQPDYIPKDMVEYSYPIEGMVNFYQGESDYGYIKLNDAGLIRPFEKEGRWDLKASFTDETGSSVRTDFTYNDESQKVRFRIPKLANEKIYHFQLLRVPSQDDVSYESNVDTVKSAITETDDGKDVDLEVQTMDAEGSIEALSEEEIYSFYIRTSRYNSLKEKLFSDDYALRSGSRQIIRAGVHMLTMNIKNGTEKFDAFEINGAAHIDPLISLESEFTDNNWYSNHLGPLLYDGYPYFETGIVTRAASKQYGVPPTKAFYFSQSNTEIQLFQENAFDQTVFKDQEDFSIKYIAADYVERQYAELRNKASSFYRDKSKPTRVENLLNSVFPIIRKGLYNTYFKYVLPGGIPGKSDFELSFYSNVGHEE